MKTSTTTLRKLFLLSTVLFFSLFNQTIAQITINGTITDPDLNPINNALVEIFDQSDTLKNYNARTDASGYFSISNITDIKNLEYNIPDDYLFIRNYPNPFNPSTVIYFELPKADNIEIKIFDILGREVHSLFSGFHNAGADEIHWDGKNNYNQAVSAGIYLCQLKTKDHFKVNKMVVLDGGTNGSGKISYNKLSNQNIQKPTKVNSIFNFTVKITGDSLDATYFRSLTCTNDTTLNLIVSKIIKTETIGIAGGTVGNDDFMISIPAGAFNENHTISLIKIEDDGAFGENTVTPSLKINGLPSYYNKPLTIKSKYSGQLNGNTFLAIGQMSENIIENDSSVVYGLYAATDSSGVLTSSFPTFSNSNLTKSTKNLDELEKLELSVKFLDSYIYKETNHFLIFFPLSAIQHVSKVEEMFEDSYAAVKHGLQKQFDESISMVIVILSQSDPIRVNLPEFQKHLIQEYNISKESLVNQQYNDIQVRAVQELFFFTSRSLFENRHWIKSAIYNWIEDWISDAPDYKYPKFLLERGYLPFYGFEEPEDPLTYESKSWSQKGEQGRGMSGVVKYLTQLENFGVGGLGKYADTHMNYPTSYLLDEVGIPPNQWWPDFFKQYINNELFDLPEGYFSKYVYRTWEINTEEDYSKIFTETYRDLSAQKFKIDLNYADLDSTKNLKFKMIGPENNKDLSLILFSINNNKLQYIETTKLAEYEIINPKSYFSNGTGEFFAVLVNSNITKDNYLGQSEISLEMNITPKVEPLNYKRCKVVAQVLADVERKYHNGTIDTTKEIINQGSSGNYGTFEGNTFTSEILSDSSQMILNVLLNETQDTIIHFEWSRIINYNDQYNTVLNQSFSGKNIPINLTDKTIYEIQGSYTCNYLNTFEYDYTYGDAYIKIPTFSCDLESYIFLQFFEE